MLVLTLMFVSNSAFAMKYFLTSQWIDKGNNMYIRFLIADAQYR